MLFVLTQLNLSPEVTIIAVIVSIVLLFLTFKFLTGFIRVLVTFILIVLIVLFLDRLVLNGFIFDKIKSLFPLLFFARRKNGCV